MGCCASAEMKYVEVEGPPIEPITSTAGDHPEAIPLGGKHDAKANIAITCGGLFITHADDATVDVLFVYPDNRYARLPAIPKPHSEPLPSRNEDDNGDGGDPREPWQSIVVQLKEFDSPDDIIKEWYDDAGAIPGVWSCETAGPLGAWARLEPHCYQQRYILPNGRRIAHPLIDPEFNPPKYVNGYAMPKKAQLPEGAEAPTEPMPGVADHQSLPDMMKVVPKVSFSLPQRLHRLYFNAGGQELLIKMTNAIDATVERLKKEATEHGVPLPPSVRDVKIDWQGILDKINATIDEFKNYQTVHDFPSPELDLLRDVLAEIEDNLIYNWFTLSVFANIQIGRYKQSAGDDDDADEAMSVKRSIWDWLLAKAITEGDKMCDGYLEENKTKIVEGVHEAISKYFKSSKKKRTIMKPPSPKKEEEEEEDEKEPTPKEEEENAPPADEPVEEVPEQPEPEPEPEEPETKEEAPQEEAEKPPVSHTLLTDGDFKVHAELTSTKRWFRLILQSDGNLVLYKMDPETRKYTEPKWSTDTCDSEASHLTLQGDGNLVLYAEGGDPLWASDTVDSGAVKLVLQNDGNLVLYNDDGKPQWASNTVDDDLGDEEAPVTPKAEEEEPPQEKEEEEPAPAATHADPMAGVEEDEEDKKKAEEASEEKPEEAPATEEAKQEEQAPENNNEGDNEDDDGEEEEEVKDMSIVEALFPDLNFIVRNAVNNVNIDPLGISDDVPDNTEDDIKLSDEEWQARFDTWKEEDAQPLTERRKAFYEETMLKARELCDNCHVEDDDLPSDFDDEDRNWAEAKPLVKHYKHDSDDEDACAARQLMHFCRMPKVMPRHFYKFTFFLVFPRWSEEKASEMKRPKVAQLKLWPQGVSHKNEHFCQPIEMTPFDLPFPEKRNDLEEILENDDLSVKDKVVEVARNAEEELKTVASRLADGDGSSDIDSSDEDDPRNEWEDYPDKNFRGFEVTVPCAIDVTYYFHFVLDDVTFLDHDSYVKKDKQDELHCRKVRFGCSANTFTVNPLKISGLVL